ncbi:hypothetical protein [Klebsiella pneumoniae]
MADEQGHVVVVGTRDCSLQRRNQNSTARAILKRRLSPTSRAT